MSLVPPDLEIPRRKIRKVEFNCKIQDKTEMCFQMSEVRIHYCRISELFLPVPRAASGATSKCSIQKPITAVSQQRPHIFALYHDFNKS